MVSPVPSEQAKSETATTWRSMTTPRVSFMSRVEIRLLRDTSKVLEYLSRHGCGQPCVYDVYEMMKRGRALQLPEYISSVEQVIQIINCNA